MQGTKTGGRVAGTPNKVTTELRNQLKEILSTQLKQLPQLLNTMPADKRLDIVLRLMPYCMPKIETISGRYDDGLDIDGWQF